jgi:WD40 repeat protein
MVGHSKLIAFVCTLALIPIFACRDGDRGLPTVNDAERTTSRTAGDAKATDRTPYEKQDARAKEIAATEKPPAKSQSPPPNELPERSPRSQPPPGRHRWSVSAAALSPNGKFALAAYKDAKDVYLRVWGTDHGKLLASVARQRPRDASWPTFCAFLAAEERFIVVSANGEATIYTLGQDGTRAKAGETMWLHDLGLSWPPAVSPDGKFLISAGLDAGYENCVTKIWDLERQTVVQVLEEDLIDELGIEVALSVGGKYALTVGVRKSSDRDTRPREETFLWDVKSKKILKTFSRKDGWFFPVGFSSDGNTFVIGQGTGVSALGDFALWDLASCKSIEVIKGAGKYGGGNRLHNISDTSVWFGESMLGPQFDPPPAVRFWDFRRPGEPRTVGLDNERFRNDLGRKTRLYCAAVASSSTGTHALVVSGDSLDTEYHLWDLKSDNMCRKWKDHPLE